MKTRYCDECGSKMQPRANQTGYSVKTGKPLYALWLYCLNTKCSRFIYSVCTSYLHKSNASKAEAEAWVK